jgi:drug/metabolite transporter (DMT)-like permease
MTDTPTVPGEPAVTAPLAAPSLSGHGWTGPMMIGGLFGLVTVVIWASWLVWTRQAMLLDMPIAWVGVMRNAMAALILAPFWLKVGLLPKGLSPLLLALMVVGAGPGFVTAAGLGMEYAPVTAQVSIIMSGTTPVVVALMGYYLTGERYTKSRLLGIAIVLVALAALGGAAFLEGNGISWIAWIAGASAATFWSIYTFAYSRSKLTPFQAAGLVAFWSTVVFLPFALWSGTHHITEAAPAFLIGQFITQGVLPIAVALVTFSEAIKRLGPSRAAMFGGLTPAVVALVAIPVLGEALDLRTAIGVTLAFVGVSLASGAIRFGRG